MTETVGPPPVGNPCPRCGYSPLFEDTGIICCAGCGSKWDAVGHAADWEEPKDE
jgi:uncharacterized Zn finger protein (UPF0148 family)